MSSQARALRPDLPRLRRAPRAPALRRRRRCDSHHRLALLARGDGAAGVREPVAAAAHVDRPRRRSDRRLLAELGLPANDARRDHADRVAAASHAGRVRGASRAHVPTGPRIPLRSRRGRHRTGRPRGRGVRRVGGARHDLARRGRVGGQAGSSSRIENYVGFPNGISGEDLARAPRSRRCGSAPGSTRRARSRACGSSTAST